MKERNGVRLGQRVRDLDGASLGRVVRLFADGFETRRGLPILIRRDYVLRYEEVRGVRDGALVVARSRSDLADLAAGGVPPAWRIPAPSAFPVIATPSEARDVRAEIARGGVPGAAVEEPEPEPDREPPLREGAPREPAAAARAEVAPYGASGHGAAPPHR